MDRELIEYLPEFMREFKEMQVICQVEQKQCVELLDMVEQIWNNQFIETADAETLSRWEKIIGIIPIDTDSLEDRRFRILKSMKLRTPYTNKVLEEYLTEVCGADNFSVEYNEETMVLKIRIALSRNNQKDAVLTWLKKVVPANLLLDYSVMYNNYMALKKYTYGQLNSFTHLQLRESESV